MIHLNKIVSRASNTVDMFSINLKNRLAIATADKTEAFDSSAIGWAVIGIVACAVALIILVGSSGDGSDTSSVFGLFKQKIMSMISAMFTKGDNVVGRLN